MFNLLKSLFSGGPKAPAKVTDIEPRLAPVDPASPYHGEAEFEAWEDARWTFKAEVETRDGGPPVPGGLIVHVDGVAIGPLTNRGDEAELKLQAHTGDATQLPRQGSSVEVHGPAGPLLSGTLRND
ncbi:MAG: hypothetical protein AAF216_05095 [Pseudomonadota bacterium]